MIPDSVQLKTKYLGLFPMINRNQFWLPAPKHSSVCTQWDGALPCLGKGVQAGMGSDSQRDGDLKDIQLRMFPSSPPKRNFSLPFRSLSLQTLKGDFEPVREVSGPFYVFGGVKGISLGRSDETTYNSKDNKGEALIEWGRQWRIQEPNKMCFCKSFVGCGL